MSLKQRLWWRGNKRQEITRSFVEDEMWSCLFFFFFRFSDQVLIWSLPDSELVSDSKSVAKNCVILCLFLFRSRSSSFSFSFFGILSSCCYWFSFQRSLYPIYSSFHFLLLLFISFSCHHFFLLRWCISRNPEALLFVLMEKKLISFRSKWKERFQFWSSFLWLQLTIWFLVCLVWLTFSLDIKF